MSNPPPPPRGVFGGGAGAADRGMTRVRPSRRGTASVARGRFLIDAEIVLFIENFSNNTLLKTKN